MENANISEKSTIFSSRTINILGWIGTASIILATVVRATDYSNILDLVLTGFGCFLWSICAYVTSNKPLLAVNVFSVVIVSLGIIRHFFS